MATEQKLELKGMNPSSEWSDEQERDFRGFTSPYAFEKKDGEWIVLLDRYTREPVTEQPIEVLKNILIRQFVRDKSGQSRISIPGLYLDRFRKSTDQFVNFAREVAYRLKIRIEDIDFDTLESGISSVQTENDIEAVKRIKEQVATGQSYYDEAYEQSWLNSIGAESAIPFFQLSIFKDALSGDIQEFEIATEPDGTTNSYTRGLFNRQDRLIGQRKKVIKEIGDKLNRIRQLRDEADKIEASLGHPTTRMDSE